MPNYRFEFLVSESPSVLVDLPTLEEAKAEAFRSLAETLWETPVDHQDPAPRATKIYDEAGHLLATVTLEYRIEPGAEYEELSSAGTEKAPGGSSNSGAE